MGLRDEKNRKKRVDKERRGWYNTGAPFKRAGKYARVAELADALDSGSSEHYAHRGSSPLPRTRLSLDAIGVPGSVFLFCLFARVCSGYLFWSLALARFTKAPVSDVPENRGLCKNSRQRDLRKEENNPFFSKGALEREST